MSTRIANRSSKSQSSRRLGFVLPTVVFGLVIRSVISAAVLHTTTLQRQSVGSFQQSGLALYAADAGLRRTVGNWPSGVSSLMPGDSLDLGWVELPNRAMYRAVIHEVDDASAKKIYTIIVQGRGIGARAGQRTVEASVSEGPPI